MNELPERNELYKGALGELIVRAVLFAHGVDASRPCADTGNDLIAVKGDQFRAVQVKSSVVDLVEKILDLGERRFHILAFVFFPKGSNRPYSVRDARVFLLGRDELMLGSYRPADLVGKEAGPATIDALFGRLIDADAELPI